MMAQREALEFLSYSFIGTAISLLPFWLLLIKPSLKSAAGENQGPSQARSQGRSQVRPYVAMFAGVVCAILLFRLLLQVAPGISGPMWGVRSFWLVAVILITFACLLQIGAGFQSLGLCAALLAWFLAIALLFNFSIGPYVNLLGDRVGEFTYNWHHWGAYLSSAKSLKAGLAIYGDFPSQYGLGPSSVIVAMSGMGWVSAMFYSVGTLELLFWICISSIGLCTVRRYTRLSPVAWFVCLSITTTTCFVWGRGDVFANFTPSLAGARYFPTALMAASILYLAPTKCAYDRTGWLLHLVWAFGALWSMESMFMVSLVWWPYYVLIMQPDEAPWSVRILSFIVAAMRLCGIALAFALVFLICYYFFYGERPSVSVFLAFAYDVPGALPINLSGPFLVVIFSFCLALWTLVRRFGRNGIDVDFLRLFCIILFSYAAMAYYIGRSHDTNVLALLPYHSLLLMEVAFGNASAFPKYAASGFLALLVGWTVAGQYGVHVDTFVAGLNFNGRELDERFIRHFENPSTDRGRAIAYINSRYGEAITAFDYVMSVVVSGPQREWNSYNSTTTYYALRGLVQRHAIRKSKERLRRSGWAITEHAGSAIDPKYILGLFANDYDLVEKLNFGTYDAYRFSPKK